MPELKTNPALLDKSPAFPSQEDAEKAVKAVNKIISSLSLFRTELRNSPQKSDVFMHLSLLEHGLAELSEQTGYEGIVNAQMKDRYAEIREANQKIRELTEQLGQTMTANAVTAGIQKYENLFRAWYKATGFWFADCTVYAHGIIAKVNSRIENGPKSHPDDKAYTAASSHPDTMFVYDEREGYDIDRDKYHSDLLDTENNRSLLQALYESAFPNAKIHGFQSNLDDGCYHMEHEVEIPYPDIEAWAEKIMKE